MPLHSISSFGGHCSLADFIAQLEKDGERVVWFTDHANSWLVLTEPKPKPKPRKRAVSTEKRPA